MNRKSPKCRRAVTFAMTQWNKYVATEKFHEEWIWRHAELLDLKKGQKITDVLHDFVPAAFYLVEGLMARSTVQENSKRKLISICLPGNMLLNTSNMESRNPLSGDIVSLKRSLLLYSPNSKILPYKTIDPVFVNYLNVLREKKLKQMRIHTELLQEESPSKRFVKFTQLLPDIYRATIQKEQAEYLEISRATVAFAKKHLL